MTQNLSGLAFQNTQVRALARDTYDHTSLEAVRNLLRDHETLRLVRFKSGGSPAVTPLYGTDADPWLCLESALDGLLINMWDRDSILQAIGELFTSQDIKLGQGLKIKSDAWRLGLLASLKHHFTYKSRFLDIITDRKSGSDYLARPNIRYNPVGLFELPDAWGHAQNDALGAINFLLFYALNNGLLSWTDCKLQPMGQAVATLLHGYWWKIHVWEDFDLGAWEDHRGVHASSIGVVLASLREQLRFMQKLEGALTYTADGITVNCDAKGVQELIDKCQATLQAILPFEYKQGDGSARVTDAALVNALFLSALSGRPLVDDAMTLQILSDIKTHLEGHIGIGRYVGDVWDGRHDRPDVPLAQWTHVASMISFIYGEMYRRTGKDEYRELQSRYFNRGLSGINERFHLTEAYIAYRNGNTWHWVSDENESLAWSQSMLLCAFAGMKASLDFAAGQSLVIAGATTSQC